MKKRLRLGKKKIQRYYKRKRMDDLDPLLPHKPKHHIERIASCVAMGPVMPELGATMATPGPFMWLSDLWNGASFSSAKVALAHSGAGAWATAKTVAVVVTIGVIGIGAGAVLVFPPSDMLDEEAAPAAASAEAFLEEGAYFAVPESPIRDGSEPVTSERTLRITLDVGGLLEGDRVIKVRGLPLSESIMENPRATLQGLPGDTIPVTVERNLSDGTGTKRLELEFEIPYLTDRFGTQSAK
jgi:hypothetical protein